MRMGTDGAIDIVEALGNAEHLGMSFDSRRDGDNARNAGRPRARDHGIELAGEIGKIEMAVAVGRGVFAFLSVPIDGCAERKKLPVGTRIVYRAGVARASEEPPAIGLDGSKALGNPVSPVSIEQRRRRRAVGEAEVLPDRPGPTGHAAVEKCVGGLEH
jgi:hypothetical protein